MCTWCSCDCVDYVVVDAHAHATSCANTNAYCFRYHARIEELVTECRHLFQERQAAGTSGKDSKRLLNQMKRKKGLVKKLLSEMYAWMSVGLPEPVDTFSEEEISNMYRTGDTPWKAVGQGATLFFGRVYHRLQSTIDRCTEELQTLGIEKERLAAWLRYTTGVLRSNIDDTPPPCVYDGEDIVVQRFLEKQYGDGRQIILSRLLSKYQKLLDELQVGW